MLQENMRALVLPLTLFRREASPRIHRPNNRSGRLPMNAEPDIATLLKLAQQEAKDHWRMVQALREGLQEIYAMRGEDPLIARIASPLIDASRP